MSQKKIVFLDIDGPLLPKKAFFTVQNQKVAKELSAIEDRRERHLYHANNIKFDECAIGLVNRLCEKGNAQVVVISNWRRNVGLNETVEILKKQGIKEEYFHKDPVCQIRGMSSNKIHDMYAWMSKHGMSYEDHDKSHELYQSPFVIIDDEGYQFNRYSSFGKCVTPSFDDGFGPREYRIALAMIGGVDHTFDVFRLTDEEILRVMKHFNGNHQHALYWLYDIQSMERTAPPSALISSEAAEIESKNPAGFFMGWQTAESLLETRSQDVWVELKELHKDFYGSE